MNSYQEYLPKAWVEIIDKVEEVREFFAEFSCEDEPVPPYLFQDFRGGNLIYLKPIFGLYGKPGLTLFERLEEIDSLTQDTAQIVTQNGQIAYAAYFFVRPRMEESAAQAAVKEYIQAVNRIFENEFHEDPPLDSHARIEFPSTEEAEAIRNEQKEAWIHGKAIPEIDIQCGIGDWFRNLEYQGSCGELAELLSEPLYHISNDFFLSYYLQWPLLAKAEEENPFFPHYKLWCMGLTTYFPEKNKGIVLS